MYLLSSPRQSQSRLFEESLTASSVMSRLKLHARASSDAGVLSFARTISASGVLRLLKSRMKKSPFFAILQHVCGCSRRLPPSPRTVRTIRTRVKEKKEHNREKASFHTLAFIERRRGSSLSLFLEEEVACATRKRSFPRERRAYLSLKSCSFFSLSIESLRFSPVKPKVGGRVAWCRDVIISRAIRFAKNKETPEKSPRVFPSKKIAVSFRRDLIRSSFFSVKENKS